jgi:predicted methyltransferase
MVRNPTWFRFSRLSAVACLAALALAGCGAPEDPAPTADTAPPAAASEEGINQRYLDPEMNAEEVAQGFEDEGREVYARRVDVVAALDLQPGMAVADIGAGSGFYVELMAADVGPTGKVYAVEISPRWIEYLNRKVTTQGLSQVTVVEGGERSVNLPPNSVDLAFASDTYHHFEYPQETLASIRQALRPGGRWVVLDYDEVPGVTPPGRMEHLRLGKVEAIAEIVAAGFKLERVVDLGLRENYLAIFNRD